MRFNYFLLTVGIVTACFAKLFLELLRLAWTDDLYSYIPLIPLISLYLIRSRKEPSPPPSLPARKTAALFLATGLVVTGLCYSMVAPGSATTAPGRLALGVTACLLLFVGLCGWFFGAAWLRTMAFPLALLVFMIPLPAAARQAIDMFLQQGSAAVAGGLFQMAGTPVLLDGLRVQLPGISLRVAEECSGIHSTLVLLITSLLAGYLFLRSPTQRATLALLVIPLALLRNGFRIFVIGELCAHYGPEMINSAIHRHGGPLFFALSLVPLLLLLFYFRKSARPRAVSPPITGRFYETY